MQLDEHGCGNQLTVVWEKFNSLGHARKNWNRSVNWKSNDCLRSYRLTPPSPKPCILKEVCWWRRQKVFKVSEPKELRLKQENVFKKHQFFIIAWLFGLASKFHRKTWALAAETFTFLATHLHKDCQKWSDLVLTSWPSVHIDPQCKLEQSTTTDRFASISATQHRTRALETTGFSISTLSRCSRPKEVGKSNLGTPFHVAVRHSRGGRARNASCKRNPLKRVWSSLEKADRFWPLFSHLKETSFSFSHSRKQRRKNTAATPQYLRETRLNAQVNSKLEAFQRQQAGLIPILKKRIDVGKAWDAQKCRLSAF